MAEIKLHVAGQSDEILVFGDRFCDITTTRWAIGEEALSKDGEHTYNYIDLLIGNGDYSVALRDVKSWLREHHHQVATFSHFAANDANVTLVFSIPYAPNEGTSGSRSIRIPRSIVQFCEAHRMEMSFMVDNWCNA